MNAEQIIKLAKIIEWFKDQPLVGRKGYEDSVVLFVKVRVDDEEYYIHEDVDDNIQVKSYEPTFYRY